MIFIVIVFILCLIGGIATVLIGMNHGEKKYTEPTRKRYMRLTLIYLVSALVLLILLYLLK